MTLHVPSDCKIARKRGKTHCDLLTSQKYRIIHVWTTCFFYFLKSATNFTWLYSPNLIFPKISQIHICKCKTCTMQKDSTFPISFYHEPIKYQEKKNERSRKLFLSEHGCHLKVASFHIYYESPQWKPLHRYTKYVGPTIPSSRKLGKISMEYLVPLSRFI